MTSRARVLWRRAAIASVVILLLVPLRASDHADPIDIFNRTPLEGGITDLFLFRADRAGRVDSNGDQVVLIFCVRRALANAATLRLEPYTYSIHLDLHSTVGRDDDQSNKRYGGRVANPDGISPDVSINFRLNNDASLREVPTQIPGLRGGDRINVLKSNELDLARLQFDPERINIWTGVTDDPFIFPVFFGTNVVTMAVTIPMTAFRDEQRDWVAWGTSSRDGKPVDHVGRSLRTQNPRFEILNTLPPREHVAAIKREHERPSLMRDLLLKLGLNQTFAYRSWDYVPDVLIYTTQAPLGFPNGRLLTDDVAEQLALYGDSLLKEISYIAGGWPRATTNDKAFQQGFPYLAAPWPNPMPRPPHMVSRANRVKLIVIALVVFGVPFLLGWLIAFVRYRRKFRLRYL